MIVYLLQLRLPGGTGVAMAARDESRAVLLGMWTKWSFMGEGEGEPGRQNMNKLPFHLRGRCVCALPENNGNSKAVTGQLMCAHTHTTHTHV